MDFPGGTSGKEPTWYCRRRTGKTQFGSLDREDPLEEGVATDSVLLLGESHGQRSLAGYGP